MGIYIQYIYNKKLCWLVSEPVRGRSRATELPCFFRFKTPGTLCLSGNLFSVTKKLPHPPPPTHTPPPSPQNTHLNDPRAIINIPTVAVRDTWTTTTNISNKYTMSEMSLYTSSSLSINVHTILVTNPITQCLYAAYLNHLYDE